MDSSLLIFFVEGGQANRQAEGGLINSAVTVYVLNNGEDRGELYVTNHSGVNNVTQVSHLNFRDKP